MASGLLGKANLTAGVDTLLFTATVGKVTTCNVRFCNTNSTQARIRLAIGTGGAPAAGDYMEYDEVCNANGIIEDTGIVLTASEKVWARSDTANVNVRAYGIEG